MEIQFGEFLKQKRLEKKLTQKELAKALFVSESAVSKWEKDIAHPDITLLPKLSEILGVTEHELITASIDEKSRTEKTQAKKWRAFSLSWSLFFYISYAIALITCFICNLAIEHNLTWFWIVFPSLILAFTFTNLPKLINKHKLILIPLSMFLALCLLLGVCCIYTHGNWFWIATLSVLLGLAMIFAPIYIAVLNVFKKIRKYNEFVSVGICFVLLNVLLFVINIHSIIHSPTPIKYWYFTIALPIVTGVYLFLNALLCVRFLPLNSFLKSSIILASINLVAYSPPMFLKLKNPRVQQKLSDANILKADFSTWNLSTINNNIHCIIALTLLVLAFIFLTIGLIRYCQKKSIKKHSIK